MKRVLLILIIGVTGKFTYANQASVINNQDSVVFDLSQAVDTLGYVYFPVSIKSDDTIFALDFSFKYDHSRLIFDSVIDLTNYIQFLSFYNGSDSVVRFTCNSLQAYTNDTPLVLVRFITLGGPIINADLNTIDVYLNGTLCSLKFISSLIDETIELKDGAPGIKYFSDPLNHKLNIYTSKQSIVYLFDTNGKLIYYRSLAIGASEIDTGNWRNGIYLLVIQNNQFCKKEKLIINW